MSSVVTKSLSKAYDETLAVDDLNIDINGGEIFTLLGPNGAGKTTIIKMLSTLLQPSSGNAFIFDKSLNKDSDRKSIREMLAVMPQSNALDPLLSVWDNLKFYAKLQKLKTQIWSKKAKTLLSMLGLEKKINASVFTLSGGQYRRVQICRTLLAEKKLLLLDEPTLGVDVSGKLLIWDLIKAFLTENNCSIILSTNDMAEAEYLSDRIAFLYKGKILRVGKPNELRLGSGNRILQVEYFDSINISSNQKTEHGIEIREKNTILFHSNSHDDCMTPLIEFAASLGAIKDIKLQQLSLTDYFKQIYEDK